jgi:DNA repair protein RecO (recombination protein O)
MDRIKKTAGIVIKYFPFMETSRIATILTCGFGKIRCVAKGYHRKKSGFENTFDPITNIKFVFYENIKKDYFLVSQADIIERYENIRQDYEKLLCAYFILETVDRALHPSQGQTEIYHKTIEAISSIEKSDNFFGIVFGHQVKILSLCGFTPKLKNCVKCAVAVTENIRFSSLGGGVVCRNCSTYFPDTKSIPRGVVTFLSSLLEMDYHTIQRIKICKDLQFFTTDIIEKFWLSHFGTLPLSLGETLKAVCKAK